MHRRWLYHLEGQGTPVEASDSSGHRYALPYRQPTNVVFEATAVAGNGQPWAFWVAPWVLQWRGALEGDHGVGYTGQPYDPETGLHYFRNRYYDAQTGRFTQEDPIGLAGGLNLYAYAANNPVNYTDPFGLCPEPKSKDGVLCLALFIQKGVGARSEGGCSRVLLQFRFACLTSLHSCGP